MKPPRTIEQNAGQDHFRRVVEQVSKVMTNISFGTTTANTDADMNMRVWKATGTAPGTPNTEFQVTHNLDHVPIGFMVVSTDRAAHIYKSSSAWTAATKTTLGKVFLKADAASVAFVIIIL